MRQNRKNFKNAAATRPRRRREKEPRDTCDDDDERRTDSCARAGDRNSLSDALFAIFSDVRSEAQSPRPRACDLQAETPKSTRLNTEKHSQSRRAERRESKQLGQRTGQGGKAGSVGCRSLDLVVTRSSSVRRALRARTTRSWRWRAGAPARWAPWPWARGALRRLRARRPPGRRRRRASARGRRRSPRPRRSSPRAPRARTS